VVDIYNAGPLVAVRLDKALCRQTTEVQQ